MFAHLLGSNAQLRPLEPWNAAELAATVDADREHLATWTVVASRVVDEATARILLQFYADAQARDAGRYLGIWLHGQLSGAALFRSFNATASVCELGGWLTSAAQGRGLMTAAYRHMIRWAEQERGISRFELRVSPANDRGQAVARRLGMTRETTMTGDLTVAGQVHDSTVWVRPRPGR